MDTHQTKRINGCTENQIDDCKYDTTSMIGIRRSALMALAFLAIIFQLPAQTSISLPGAYYQIFQNYPLTNEKISFSRYTPFTENKRMIIDSEYSYQHLMSVPKVGDSLLSECIKYAMLSLSFDLVFKNHSKGTEIWYGLITHGHYQRFFH